MTSSLGLVSIASPVLETVTGGAPKPGQPGFIGPVSPAGRPNPDPKCWATRPPGMYNGDNVPKPRGPSVTDKMNAGIALFIQGDLNPFGWMPAK